MNFQSIANDNTFYGAFGAYVEMLHEVELRHAASSHVAARAHAAPYFSIKTAAAAFAGDWVAFSAAYPADAELIVNYVDRSGDLYLSRLAEVKALFPSFNY